MEDSATSEDDRKKIFRLTPRSALSVWRDIFAFNNENRFPIDHWSRNYMMLGPSFRDFLDEASWRGEVNRFFEEQLLWKRTETILCIIDTEKSYLTDAQTYRRSWDDFRAELDIAITISLDSKQFVTVTNYGPAMIGERPQVSWSLDWNTNRELEE